MTTIQIGNVAALLDGIVYAAEHFGGDYDVAAAHQEFADILTDKAGPGVHVANNGHIFATIWASDRARNINWIELAESVDLVAILERHNYHHQLNSIAHVVHEANRALQIEQADPAIPVSDPWEQIGEEMRQSIIDGIKHVQRGTTRAQSHKNWCDFKIYRGWTFGPVKDETKKQHPLLIPYDELPPSQQLKDELFAAIVKTLS